jgi:hypothetical protein
MQGGNRDVPVAQRHREQDPVQGVRDAGLYLPDQRVARPFVGVPERKAAGVKLPRLEVQPRAHHVGLVRAFEPGPFPG